MIFKGQPGKTNEKKLQDIEELKKTNFYLLPTEFMGYN